MPHQKAFNIPKSFAGGVNQMGQQRKLAKDKQSLVIEIVKLQTESFFEVSLKWSIWQKLRLCIKIRIPVRNKAKWFISGLNLCVKAQFQRIVAFLMYLLTPQHVEWDLNKNEKTFIWTFAGWKSIHQGFRIHFFLKF